MKQNSHLVIHLGIACAVLLIGLSIPMIVDPFIQVSGFWGDVASFGRDHIGGIACFNIITYLFFIYVSKRLGLNRYLIHVSWLVVFCGIAIFASTFFKDDGQLVRRILSLCLVCCIVAHGLMATFSKGTFKKGLRIFGALRLVAIPIIIAAFFVTLFTHYIEYAICVANFLWFVVLPLSDIIFYLTSKKAIDLSQEEFHVDLVES